AHVKVGTHVTTDWPAVIVINHYQASQITAGQSGCDTEPDVLTLTCVHGAHIRKTLYIYYGTRKSIEMEDRRQAMVLFLPRDRRYPSEILFAPMHGYLKATGKDPGGPKIGQEYSVPFVEEEWADDEYVNVDALLVHNTNTFVN
ncbi:hypothetical protein Tco_1040136, partial [Tanacetum coccineum]